MSECQRCGLHAARPRQFGPDEYDLCDGCAEHVARVRAQSRQRSGWGTTGP